MKRLPIQALVLLAFAVIPAFTYAQDPPKRIAQQVIAATSKKGSLPLSATEKQALTNWLSVNGESLTGVKPWKVQGEGPSMKDSTGVYAATDFKFAESADALYVFAMELPKQDMRIKSLATSVDGKIIGTVTLLGSKEQLSWEQEERELLLELPHKLPTEGPVVFKITWTEYYVEKSPDPSIKIIAP